MNAKSSMDFATLLYETVEFFHWKNKNCMFSFGMNLLMIVNTFCIFKSIACQSARVAIQSVSWMPFVIADAAVMMFTNDQQHTSIIICAAATILFVSLR